MKPTWWDLQFPNGLQYVTIPDTNNEPVQIAYAEKGTGKPLVLVQGWGSWSYAWRKNIDALAEQFRVICFDGKGYGYSEKRPTREKAGHQIEETFHILAALTAEPVIMVAESLGSVIALAIAQHHPERISHLILIDCAVFPQKLPNMGMQLLTYLPLMGVQRLDEWGWIRLFSPLIQWITYVAQGEIYTNQSISYDAIKTVIDPFIRERYAVTQLVQDTQIAAREIQKYRKHQPNLLWEIHNRLSQVKQPTLILWGENDHWFPPSDGEKLCNLLPNAQLKIIPNCGHHAPGDQPEIVNTEILNFLQQEN
ncbi:MAG: alpha/beta hydrolase [Gemmatimonadetes bacterium]|nr:MAG: alpha/beta hydrolase [Gemmatimonadota bacterium]